MTDSAARVEHNNDLALLRLSTNGTSRTAPVLKLLEALPIDAIYRVLHLLLATLVRLASSQTRLLTRKSLHHDVPLFIEHLAAQLDQPMFEIPQNFRQGSVLGRDPCRQSADPGRTPIGA